MKKIFCFIFCLIIFLTGCGQQPSVETTSAPTTFTENVTQPTVILPQQEAMYAISIPTISETTLADDGTVIFSYTYQSMNLTLPDPDVAEKIINDFRSKIKSGTETANEVLAQANTKYNGSSNWTPYIYNITYSPTRMDQGVLSLFGNRVTYSGTSHPERLSMSANYDLVTGDVLTLGSIMSAQATREHFCSLVLEKLDTMKDEKSLYEGYESTVKQRFSRDESQDQDWYFSTNGLCFYFVPYEVAPYSSGVVVAEIPYSELTGLLYDGYFPAERETSTGTIQATDLDETDTTQFTQIAELVLNPDGEMVFLHTQGLIWDVKIEYGAWDTANTTFSPVYTALFTGSLSPGDAIMIQSSEITSLRITYTSGTETVTQHFIHSEDGIQLSSNGVIKPL